MSSTRCSCANTNKAMAKIEIDADAHAEATAHIDVITKVSLFFFGNASQECCIKFNDESPLRLNAGNIENFTAYVNTCDNFAPVQLSICGEKGAYCCNCNRGQTDDCEVFELAVMNLLTRTNLKCIYFKMTVTRHSPTLGRIVRALVTFASVTKIKINARTNMSYYHIFFRRLRITSLTIKNIGDLHNINAWGQIYHHLCNKATIQSLKLYNLKCDHAFIGNILAIGSIKMLCLQLQSNLLPMKEADLLSMMDKIAKHPCLENVRIDSIEELPVNTSIPFINVSPENFYDMFEHNATLRNIIFSPYSEIYSEAFDVINGRKYATSKSAMKR